MKYIHKQQYLTPVILIVLLLLNCFSYGQPNANRANATHNVGQVGYFTTNIGQFYPYGGQFEKTLEYPINSGHICMYRQCIMFGVPVNVISAADGRFEEFNAVAGYHNPNGFNMAISDNPTTWPATGWPVKDSNGNEIFLAQQESYCVYSDSTNWRYFVNGEQDQLMDIRVHQTIYSWGVPDADKFHILRFQIENKGANPLLESYFNFYSDIDIGGQDNAAREWADDCVEFDKSRELVYFYDSDNYSDEWGEANPFLSGVTFLQTPNDSGITDFHWIDVNIDEVDVAAAQWDSVSYYLMRSDTSWFHERNQRMGDFPVADYFHLGDNPIKGTHYDDPATSRIMDAGNLVGGPMVAYICNGPFDIQPGDTAEFWIGVMVGDDENDLLNVTDKIREYYNDGFNIATVPQPTLNADGGDKKVSLYWDNSLDISYENQAINPPSNDLEGYILYRTTDQTLKIWSVVDTIAMQYKGDSVLVDRAYNYIDSSDVYNGFDYFYNLTAYRYSPVGFIEESILLRDINNLDNSSSTIKIEPTSSVALVKKDMNKIKVVPNPFIISAPWDEERLGNTAFGEPVRNISFTNLPSPCTIKIFTVDGDLVNTIYHSGDTGRQEWNLLTSENRPVVSGIYFFHVKSDIGEKVGRFAIIR